MPVCVYIEAMSRRFRPNLLLAALLGSILASLILAGSAYGPAPVSDPAAMPAMFLPGETEEDVPVEIIFPFWDSEPVPATLTSEKT